MASVISGAICPTNLSHEDSSSVFGSARTHQSNAGKSSSSLNFSRMDYSELTPGKHSSILDGHPGNSGDSVAMEDRDLDSPTITSEEPLEKDCDEHMIQDLEDIESQGGQGFVTTIRSHGAPLDTITERTSIATIQEPLSCHDASSSATIQNLGRKFSAPDATTLRKWNCEERRFTKSLDETVLETQRPLNRRQIISESSESASCVESHAASPAKPLMLPPRRITTPPGLPRWPGDLPTSLPKPNIVANRRTSAYVRDIYRKLVGGEQRGQKSPNIAGPSRIPVPSHLTCGGRTGRAYWKPPESEHGKKGLHDVHSHLFHDSEMIEIGSSIKKHKDNQDGESKMSVYECPRILHPKSSEDENIQHSRATPKGLSSILARTGRLFDSPRTSSTIATSNTSLVSERPNTPTPRRSRRATVRNTAEAMDLQLSASLVYSACEQEGGALEQNPTVSPKPLAPRNRSIFDIRAEEPREVVCYSKSISSPVLDNSILTVRNGLSSSSISETSESRTPNSWVLPLDPFPQPPSPNYFVTARSSRHSHDNTALQRHTNGNIPVDPTFAPSESNIDKAVEEPAARSIAASNSSTSLVLKQPLAQRTTNALPNDSDPFLSRAKVQDFDGIVALETTPDSANTPKTPIHLPSPLRPGNRPNPKYSLFPVEEASVGPPQTRSKEPLIRNLRSLSSMLRVPSATMRASKSSDLKGRVIERTCPHGMPVEHSNVFSGRKIGGRAWRLRHRIRDGGLRCWRCKLERFRGISDQLFRRVMGGGTKTRQTNVAAMSSGYERLSPPPPVMKDAVPRPATRHPLEAIEKRRVARDKQLDGSASINKAMAFGDKWASWTPRCFCQVLDDGTSIRGMQEKEIPRARSAHIRTVID